MVETVEADVCSRTPETEELLQTGQRLLEWIAAYLGEGGESYPVLSRLSPGDIRAAIPAAAPEHGTPLAEILADFERLLVPGLTHWNQPGFMAYFVSSAGAAGVLGELLTAALNQQAMLWRTSPAATELEEVVLGWLRDLLGLPPSFEGTLYDGGSSSNLHALLAARQAAAPAARATGLAGSPLPPLRVYCSQHAHSSVDKAMIVLGLGIESLRRVPVDADFRLRADALAAAMMADERAGYRPMAVVATVGTTSTASVDPLPEIAAICRHRRVWLHVDACYGGPAAMLPETAWILDGAAAADSLVVNPHKWLFTPLDCSAFYCRRMDVLREALSLTPDYLQTPEADAVRNGMDTSIALGRRFRALKLWMVLRHHGSEGLRARLREHLRLARLFASWVDADADFQRLAPVTLGLVCFRAAPAGSDEAELEGLNAALLARVNGSGEVFLSHTRLEGRLTLRLAVGHLRTAGAHVARAWSCLRRELRALRGGEQETGTPATAT
jgi:aromatic-L-amino-acid/L-tryptophan decarboxylase